MAEPYIPTQEGQLVAYSTNFSDVVAADPVAVGLDLILSGAFTALNTAWVDSYNLIQNALTRSPANIATKNTNKAAMIANLRSLMPLIQGHPGITDSQLLQLGLTVRDTEPTVIPVPIDPPQVTLVKVSGREVTIRLRDILNPDQRARPDGVKGATLFSFIGDVVSQDLDDFTFQGNTGLTEVDMTFPLSVPEGTKVWITASWFNPRTQNGPAAEPQDARIQFGGQMSEAA